MSQSVLADPNLNSWNTSISLDVDRDAIFEVEFEYNETITEHEYFVRADIRDVRVYINDQRTECDVQEKNIGTTIKCTNIEAQKIRYVFIAKEVINNFNIWKNFDYRFSVSRITNKFAVTVKLPVGFTIVDRDKLEGTGIYPIEPDGGSSGSDGRRIFVTWTLEEPLLGDKLDVSVVYERTGFDIEQILLIAFVLFLIFAMVAITITFRKRGVGDILTVLHENERKVVQILLKENKGVDQRRIVKETGLSKSMISRLVKDLELRNIIKVDKKGRTNRLTLVSRAKAKSIEQKKKPISEQDKDSEKENLPYIPEKQENSEDLE